MESDRYSKTAHSNDIRLRFWQEKIKLYSILELQNIKNYVVMLTDLYFSFINQTTLPYQRNFKIENPKSLIFIVLLVSRELLT